jgi:hypothetical protein
MMLARLLLSTILVLPLAAHAACSLSQPDRNTLTVTVGSKNCLRSAEAKAAFARNLKMAVSAMNAATDTRANGDTRTSAQQKLYNIADLQNQATYLAGPRYFGQK